MTSFFKNRFTIGVVLGALTMGAVNITKESFSEINYLPSPSMVSRTHEFSTVNVDPSWIKSGTPNFRATMFAESPDGKRKSGIWLCDGPSTFEWSFGLDETVYILEGGVDITYMGKTFTLKPGDAANFHAGTKAVWHVPKYLKKSFTLHNPEKLVRIYRKVIDKIL